MSAVCLILMNNKFDKSSAAHMCKIRGEFYRTYITGFPLYFVSNSYSFRNLIVLINILKHFSIRNVEYLVEYPQGYNS